MNLKIRASLAFKRNKPAGKATFGNSVLNGLNAYASEFPNLPVSATDLRRINTELANAIVGAASGNHAAVALVKEKVLVWDDAFTDTANYVTTVANGSDVIVRNAGFVPTKSETTPAQKPDASDSFYATINGSRGAIKAGSRKKIKEAKMYVFTAVPEGAAISYNGNTMIISVGGKEVYINVDTQRQTEFCNLPSDVPFNVSMYAVNSAGSGPATTPQRVVTQ